LRRHDLHRKPDTLVTVEENKAESNKPTSVEEHQPRPSRFMDAELPDSKAAVSTEDVNAHRTPTAAQL
jgi:hypothetical protein